jgi:sulfite exporter TauE/SafE
VSTVGARLAQATVGRWLGGVMASSSLAAPLAIGVFNALLPCQLIYAFAARAAATASLSAGALVMLSFGLGTLPAMLGLGLSHSLLRPALRVRLARSSSWIVVAFGILTVLRGLLGTHGAHH